MEVIQHNENQPKNYIMKTIEWNYYDGHYSINGDYTLDELRSELELLRNKIKSLPFWRSKISLKKKIHGLEFQVWKQDPECQKKEKERQEWVNEFWRARWDSGYYNKCRCSCSEPNEPYMPGLL